MLRLRRVLAPLTALWLLCQFATVALVPAALRGAASSVHRIECTCGHGDGLTCLMHHHQPAGEATRCAMQALDHSATAVLAALAGVAGFIAQPVRSMQPPASVAHRQFTAALSIGQPPVPPDPPPPRA